MNPSTGHNPITRGLLAGFFGGILGVLLFYGVAVVATAFYTRDFFATLLAAATYIPLMLLFFSLPLMMLGLAIGLSLGVIGKTQSEVPNLGIALLAGGVVGFLVLRLLLPLVFTPKPGDFTSIVSGVYFALGYGAVVGVISQRLFRKLAEPGFQRNGIG